MKRFHRQILLWSSVAFFLGLAPLLVIYAMGYRFQSTGQQSDPVGVLIVESIPRNAQVDIDGRDRGSTPQSVTNLPSGRTTVTVSKSGYTPWQKSLAIEPVKVNELRDIRLFPANPNRNTLLSNVQTFSLSPDRRHIAAISGGQLHIIDEDGVAVTPPRTMTQVPRQLLWSPDSGALLATGGLLPTMFPVDAAEQSVVLSRLADARDIVWDPRIPGRLLALTPNGDLVAYQVSTDTLEVLLSDVLTYAASARQIIAITAGQEIVMRNLQGNGTKSRRLGDDMTIEKLHVTPAGLITAQLSDKNISLISGDLVEYQPIAVDVDQVGWSPDGQLLLLQAEDSALHVYNVDDDRLPHVPLETSQLVIRLSQPIRDAQWFAGGRHVIYQVADEIFITEIDTRDMPITYRVDATNLGNSLATVGARGDTLLYLKRTADNTRLVKASLTVEE